MKDDANAENGGGSLGEQQVKNAYDAEESASDLLHFGLLHLKDSSEGPAGVATG